MKTYNVKKCSMPVPIDANWNKPAWQGFEALNINLPHWPVQSVHLPDTKMKMQYDDEYLYLIFQVHDQYIKATVTEINGPVCQDSCVEFFFAPNQGNPDSYFNLEINCCGVMLMQYHSGPRKNSRFVNLEDCQKIRIASSASGPILHEITKPLTWTVGYALPLDILSNYTEIERPRSGVCWRGNFYKCADDSSCPHWISWSPVLGEKPEFHQPDCFGVLEFM